MEYLRTETLSRPSNTGAKTYLKGTELGKHVGIFTVYASRANIPFFFLGKAEGCVQFSVLPRGVRAFFLFFCSPRVALRHLWIQVAQGIMRCGASPRLVPGTLFLTCASAAKARTLEASSFKVQPLNERSRHGPREHDTSVCTQEGTSACSH